MVMNSRDSLPALNEMTTVQVMGQYSVSRANGRGRYSGGGNVKAERQCGGNNSPRAPLVLSCGCAARQAKGDGKTYAVRWFNAPGNLHWQRDSRFLSARGPRATSGARSVGMSRRNSLPPLSEMTTVQVKGQYSVSGADGRGWYSGIGKCRADGRK